MAYIDEFLEINSSLPRDVIRLIKLVREIDEKAYSKFYYFIRLSDSIRNQAEQLKSAGTIEK